MHLPAVEFGKSVRFVLTPPQGCGTRPATRQREASGLVVFSPVPSLSQHPLTEDEGGNRMATAHASSATHAAQQSSSVDTDGKCLCTRRTDNHRNVSTSNQSVSFDEHSRRQAEGRVHDAGQDICSRIAGHWTPFSTLHWLTETTFNSSVSQPVSIRPCATYELAQRCHQNQAQWNSMSITPYVQLIRTDLALLITNTIVLANSEIRRQRRMRTTSTSTRTRARRTE